MLDELANIKAQIDELLADEEMPDEVAPGVTLDAIREAINEIYVEELQQFNRSMEVADTDDQQEVLRIFVESVAEKIALIMAFHAGIRTVVAVIDADDAVSITRNFFAHGVANLRLAISDR